MSNFLHSNWMFIPFVIHLILFVVWLFMPTKQLQEKIADIAVKFFGIWMLIAMFIILAIS